MLAENFKSPAELGLLDKEHRALVTVLRMLERHELRLGDWSLKPNGSSCWSFNMAIWHTHIPGCGTVACIGGSAELAGDFQFGHFDNVATQLSETGKSDLFKLFYPPYMGKEELARVEPDRAAQVLRTYLTTGKTRW
jgi:hypothetical protein